MLILPSIYQQYFTVLIIGIYHQNIADLTVKISQNYRYFNIKISLFWPSKYHRNSIELITKYRFCPHQNIAVLTIKISPKYCWFYCKIITKLKLILHQNIAHLIIKISLIWPWFDENCSASLFHDYLYRSIQNSWISHFLFWFSTLKTCLESDKFWPHLTLCKLWYMIQYTSSLPVIIHTMFPWTVFGRFLEFQKNVVSVFNFENLFWQIFTLSHNVRTLVHDSTYIYYLDDIDTCHISSSQGYLGLFFGKFWHFEIFSFGFRPWKPFWT